MAVGKSATDVEIFKPRIDKRAYRRIVLSNSLEALLISDPDTDKAAASMVVSVGYFSDPDGLEGLAHFLEHMLFFASEKYPMEDSYSKYITEHGGSTNAFTAPDLTNFYFDVNVDCFEEALDRFAQFFIKPLMSPDATIREIKAVDSENRKNLLSDGWRMNQLHKHLSSKDHPYHKFGTGSWDTLEVKPKEKGIDTRNELLKFYQENYSANLMQLVVYGKETLDEIQTQVEKKFDSIRNLGRNCFHFPGQPCTSEHLQILVKAVPIKQGHTLRIIWPITPSIRNYKEGPCRYLGHLIGHEGEGSLFYILKTLGWAMGLSAGEGDWSLEFSFFNVIIELTDAGHEHVEDIVGLLFKYILLLQRSGVTKWIFDELAAICKNGFHYQDKVRPRDYVVNISSNMKLYPPEDWLVGSSLPSKFVPSTIQSALDELNMENVRVFWESKKFEGCTDLVEPWYGTAYSIDKITASTIQQWVEKAPNAYLHLPSPNIFIPTDLSLKGLQEKVKFPTLLRKSSFSRLWYKPDTMFFTPKAYIRIDFNCPLSSHSPEAEVLTDIFTRLLMDYLNEYAYDAQVAGLDYAIRHADTGFQLKAELTLSTINVVNPLAGIQQDIHRLQDLKKFSQKEVVIVVGYNHKMRILLETIVLKLHQFEVKPDRFAVIKEAVIKEYQNFKFQQPYQQAMYYCTLLLEDHTWPWSEELDVLPYLEADHLAKFAPILLSKTFLECLVAGNIEPAEAESVVQHVEDVLFRGPQPTSKPLFPSQHLTNRVVKLDKGVIYHYPVEGLNQKDENSSLVHYIQVHQDDIKLDVKLQLFALVAKQPAFHQLRSVEQLGYITVLMKRNKGVIPVVVVVVHRNDSGVRGAQFIIQSTVKDPAELDVRVGAFLKLFEGKLYEMSEEEYKSNVNALIDMKLEKHKNLRDEAAFYWGEISDGTLKFDRRDSEVAALRDLKKEELVDFFNYYIKVDSPHRKTLSVQVYGGVHSAEYKKTINEADEPGRYQIKDIFSFRRSRPLYGSFKGGLGHMKL